MNKVKGDLFLVTSLKLIEQYIYSFMLRLCGNWRISNTIEMLTTLDISFLKHDFEHVKLKAMKHEVTMTQIAKMYEANYNDI